MSITEDIVDNKIEELVKYIMALVYEHTTIRGGNEDTELDFDEDEDKIVEELKVEVIDWLSSSFFPSLSYDKSEELMYLKEQERDEKIERFLDVIGEDENETGQDTET